MPAAIVAVVERIAENCEPALTTVLFMAGAGGSLRAGVTENPVRLTRSVKDALTRVTCGGAPVYVWPGGGITLMVDVSRMPEGSFGYVPTPALVAPIEFTLSREDYAALGGHLESIVAARRRARRPAPDDARPGTSQSLAGAAAASRRRGDMSGSAQAVLLPDGRRLHLQHGPIDIIAEAFGDAGGGPPRLSPGGGALRDRAGRAGRRARPAAPAARRGAAAGRRCDRAAHGGRRLAVSRALRHADGRGRRRGRRGGAGGDDRRARACAKAYVNDGGDIALHLAPGEALRAGVVADADLPALDGQPSLVRTRCRCAASRPRAGAGARFSLGIADAVTVLAASAAAADAAATMIANAVDCDHPAIRRSAREPLARRYGSRRSSGDGRGRRAARRGGRAGAGAGAGAPRRWRRAGLIVAASLMLQGRVRTVGGLRRGQEDVKVAG